MRLSGKSDLCLFVKKSANDTLREATDFRHVVLASTTCNMKLLDCDLVALNLMARFTELLPQLWAEITALSQELKNVAQKRTSNKDDKDVVGFYGTGNIVLKDYLLTTTVNCTCIGVIVS